MRAHAWVTVACVFVAVAVCPSRGTAGEGDEPGKSVYVGETPSAPAEAQAQVTRSSEETVYAVGTKIRGIFVPAWFIEAFTRHAHGLNSFSWGADFTRRKGNLDIVAGVDVGWYGNIKDANWTGNDESGYAGDTYWVEFHKFVFTSIDVNWIWNYSFAPWIALRAGGGVGIGFLGGSMYKTHSGPACSAANVDNNLSQCGPIGVREKEDLKYYRVLPVVSALLGLRFTLHRHVVVNVEGGFHNAFFVGAGGQYVF